MNIQNDCHQLVEGILGCSTELTLDEIIEIVNEVLETTLEKKLNDLVRKYLEDLIFLKSDNFEIYRQNKEKILYSNLKLDNKTRCSNPVLNDNLSPTIHAFYFCDKSRQVLSDKEAAALKVMSLENNFEMIDEDCLAGKYKVKDFDQDSNGSNSNSNAQLSLYNSSYLEKGENTAHLKKKRRFSMKINSANKKITKKVPRSNNRNNPYDFNEDHKNNYNLNDDNNEEDEEDKEYCISQCLLGRKYQEANDLMIGCDKCENWYHPKCIKMTDEEFEMVKNSDWLCTECKNIK